MKGDKHIFLDYEIIECTNSDGVVLKKTNAGSTYECHLGNYGPCDTAENSAKSVKNAKISACLYFMIARPHLFAKQIFYRINRGFDSGTQHEYFKFKDAVEKEGLTMPPEITAGDGINLLIRFDGKPLHIGDL